MELEITWKRAALIWWSYLQRNIFAIAGAVIIRAIVVFILGLPGTSFQTIQFIFQPIGLLIGLGISIIPSKLIWSKKFW